jgi:hypothetical protein
MPGTFSASDFTTIETADTEDYDEVGTLKTAEAINDDYKVEGTNCETFGISSATGTGTTTLFTPTSANLDLSAAGLHFYQWIKCVAWPSMATQRAGGTGVAISSDAPPTAIQCNLSATISAAGTGYSVGDTLTVSGGTQTQTAQFTVVTLSGSGVASVTPKATQRGAYTVLPANPAATTVSPAGGTGCTLTVTWVYSTTNTKEWWIGGSDTVVVDGWVCYVVEVSGTADLQATSPAVSSVDRVGVRATAVATSKILTHAIDINRYTTGGIIINDGTSGAPIAFTDVQAWDNANARAVGVVTQQSGIYFMAGKLKIGTTGQTAVTYFKDTNQVVVFQGFPVNTSFYEFILAGAGSFLTTFQLGNLTGTVASGGCTIRGANRYTHFGGAFVSYIPAIWTLTASAANTLCNLYGSTFSEMKALLLASTSDVQFCTFKNSGTITPAGATIKFCNFFDLRTTSPISATYQISVTTTTPDLRSNTFTNCPTAILWDRNADTNGKLDDCSFTYGASLAAGTPGHAIELSTNCPTAVTLSGLLFSGYGAALVQFHTTNDVSSGADTVTKTGHGYTTGEQVMYRKQGGTQAIGLTDATVYYVRAVDANTLAFYTTNALAVSDTSRINLTAGGAETHEVASMAAAIYNNRAGACSITVAAGGSTPTIRNGSGASTTLVLGQTTVTLTGLINDSEVRVYDSGDNSVIDGTESVTGNEFAFADDAGNTVYIRIFHTQYLPADITGYVIPATDTDVPVSQVFDRVYSND